MPVSGMNSSHIGGFRSSWGYGHLAGLSLSHDAGGGPLIAPTTKTTTTIIIAATTVTAASTLRKVQLTLSIEQVTLAPVLSALVRATFSA